MSNHSSIGTWIRNKERDSYRNDCWWKACVDIGNTTYILETVCALFFVSIIRILLVYEFHPLVYTWKANKLHQLFNEIESHFTFQIWATAGEWVMIEWKEASTDFLALTRFALNCSFVFSTSLFGRSIDNVYNMMRKYNKKTVEMFSTVIVSLYVLIAWCYQLKNYDVWKNAIKSHK